MALLSNLYDHDHVVSTAAEKARLAPFAEAVDMENFWILSRRHQKFRR
jgi:hypothetical protein